MRFVKQAFLKNKFIVDRSLFVDINGSVQFAGAIQGIQIGGGNTSQRSPVPSNGTIRYNTQLGELEVYVGNSWELLRTNRPGTIQVQNLGTGDASATEFGPLDPAPVAAENIITLVENVIQIPGVNYTLIDNGGDKYVKFDSPVPFGKDVTVMHGYDGSILGS